MSLIVSALGADAFTSGGFALTTLCPREVGDHYNRCGEGNSSQPFIVDMTVRQLELVVAPPIEPTSLKCRGPYDGITDYEFECARYLMHRKGPMKEIRVRWRFGLHEDDQGSPTDGGVWFPDSPDNRGDLMIVIEEGNKVAGDGSHWLEEREA